MRKIGHVNRVAILSRDKTDVSRGGGSKWQREEDGWRMSWKNDMSYDSRTQDSSAFNVKLKLTRVPVMRPHAVSNINGSY